jgi:hypothetical protein
MAEAGPTKTLLQGLFTGLVYFLVTGIFSPELFDKMFWFYCAILETTLFIVGKNPDELAGIRPRFGVMS